MHEIGNLDPDLTYRFTKKKEKKKKRKKKRGGLDKKKKASMNEKRDGIRVDLHRENRSSGEGKQRERGERDLYRKENKRN